MARKQKKTSTFGADPQMLKTGRKNKRITPGVRNALFCAVILVAVAELLYRTGLIPEVGALVLDIAGLIIALAAAAAGVRK